MVDKNNLKAIIGFGVIISLVGLSGALFIGLFSQQEPVASYGDLTTFTDSMNRDVVVPVHPSRIISMSPSITEILYELGVDDRLVGVTNYCNYPVDATTKTKVGGFSSPNVETIISLSPDLIITASWDPDIIAQLDYLVLGVVVILAEDLEGTIENIKAIGDLVDAEAKGIEVANNLTLEMEEITNETSNIAQIDKIDCYFEVWETPKVAGGISFINDMIDKAGAINIFKDLTLKWPTVSHESVIDGDPDVIFITEHSAPWYSQAVCDRAGYNVVNACINARVYSAYDDIYLRQGPRIIMALENMTRYLYPSLLP